jgi:hypothetical protein
VKLLEAIKTDGRPFEIPDCSRDELPQYFVEMGYKVGAEIGVYKAEYTKDAGLKIFGVDPWLDYSDYHNTKGQERISYLYEHAKRVVAPYPNCTLIKKTSVEAAAEFEDESLDFVYIDANHLLQYVIEDICVWSKKVKKGGVISGHDYFYKKRDKSNVIHVPFAIKAYVDAYDIKSWYVLGSEKHIEGEKRDRWRSWMWIKDYLEPTPLIEA